WILSVRGGNLHASAKVGQAFLLVHKSPCRMPMDRQECWSHRRRTGILACPCLSVRKTPRRRGRSKMTRGKKRFLVGLVVLIIGVVAAIKIYRRLPSRAVLVLDVGGPIDEQRPVGGQPVAARSATLLHDLTDAIDTARDDSRITGLVVKIEPLGGGWGKVQELRAQLLELRKSKKQNICSLVEEDSGKEEYELATAIGQRAQLPSAEV